MSKNGGLIMKKIIVLVTLIVCGAVIILGNLHWNQKLSAQGESIAKKAVPVEAIKEEKQVKPDVLTYATNLPEDVQEKIKIAVDSNEPVEFVIFGTSDVEGTWIEPFKKEITTTYGENVFEITAISTGDNSTRELVNEEIYEEVNELEPDVLLFEAPMLKDNGNVGINNTLVNLEEIVDAWQEANEDMILLIQPSQPLYDPLYYHSEVKQLQEFAKKEDLIYLNHWENWPDLDDVEMKDYLTKDKKVNEKGYEVWAEYLIKYFVAK